MKKGGNILMIVCSLSLMLVLGVFIGRNTNSDKVTLKENTVPISETVKMSISDYRLDINKATKIQLMELPGIGEIIADRIIAYRTDNGAFSSIDDLLNVQGIGSTKLQRIEGYIRIGG